MTVQQISVFVENKPGQLAEFSNLLRENDIDMRALSIAEAKDFGILRVIVDNSYRAACVLKDAGYVFSITKVIAVAVPDEPGSLFTILDILKDADINLEYTYAFITRKTDVAYMIFRVADNEKAIEALSNHGIRLISQSELSEM